MPTATDLDAMNAQLARHWWAVVLRGVLAIVFGIIALTTPGAAIMSLALIFAAYLLVDGLLAIVAAVRAAQAHERWGMLLMEGLLNLIMGVITVTFPVAAVVVFIWLLAGWALITGALMVVAAFRLHLTHGRWWLVFGGLASLIWGVVLCIAPLVGAVVLAWWLGAYALIFGIMLLVLGFRLRGQHTGDGVPNRA